jgi:predicted PurR-regulated permease PerM
MQHGTISSHRVVVVVVVVVAVVVVVVVVVAVVELVCVMGRELCLRASTFRRFEISQLLHFQGQAAQEYTRMTCLTVKLKEIRSFETS